MKPFVEKIIRIEQLNSKGYGLADSLEVPKTLPDEEVVVQLVKRDRGKLLSVIKPSPLRVVPRCDHFAVCGGCKIQEMEYEAQTAWKEQLVKSLLKPQEFLPIIPSPLIYDWRNKMEFTFSSDKAGHKFLGLIMQEGNGKVVNLQRCHLARSWMSQILEPIRQWWEDEQLTAYKHTQNKGTLRSLFLREGMTTNDRMVMLHVSGNPEDAMSETNPCF